jgi:uncharacterized membrane protein YphA (DoxX/SURF4 family)
MTRTSDTPLASAETAHVHRMAGQGRIGLLGLLAVQAIIGYEWLVSGLAKIFGGFVGQFGAKLPDSSQAAPDWFKAILNAVVAPSPTFWAVVIELGETLIGVALIGAAALWAWRLDRLPRIAHVLLVAVTALAAISATVLAITLHVMNGGSHPWLLPSNAFDEGVDLDSLLPAIQVVLFVVSVCLLRQMRKAAPKAHPVIEGTAVPDTGDVVGTPVRSST